MKTISPQEFHHLFMRDVVSTFSASDEDDDEVELKLVDGTAEGELRLIAFSGYATIEVTVTFDKGCIPRMVVNTTMKSTVSDQDDLSRSEEKFQAAYWMIDNAHTMLEKFTEVFADTLLGVSS